MTCADAETDIFDLGCLGKTVVEYGLRVDLAIAFARGSGLVLSTGGRDQQTRTG